MSKKNIIKFFLILFVTNTHAESVFCPKIEALQNAADKINIATKFEGMYTVYTEDYVFLENKVYWRVGAKQFFAASDSEALQKGKYLVQHIHFKDQETAIEITPDQFSCTYGPEKVFALGSKLNLN